ncbi:MAG: hypothetical protein PHH37_15145 [Paludibacter sp.]|nr:hypothetical protein [Paludibacter sp.]
MNIEVIKVRDLGSFIDSELYESLSNIPISRLRALSQLNNPRADGDDVALIFAHDNGTLYAYIGLLPDRIWIDNISQKIWWNTCWWTNESESNNVSIQLFFMACKFTQGQFYFPELTPHTSVLISKIKGFTVNNHFGIRAYLYANLVTLLPARKKIFSQVRPLLIVADKMINLTYWPISKFWQNKLAAKCLNYELVNQVDDEISAFIAVHNTGELFRRNKTELNWINYYPWITETNAIIPSRYAFSLYVKFFKNTMVKVYKDALLIGFFILLVRDGNAKLTYCYFDNEFLTDVVDVLYEIILKNKINTFVAFDPAISEYIKKNKNPFILIRKHVKTVGFPSILKSGMSPEVLQDGDGDCAFT